MKSQLLDRLDAQDRALFLRCALQGPARSILARRAWQLATHLGGTTASILAALIPLLTVPAMREPAGDALMALAISHAVVQMVKRTVMRERPDVRTARSPLVGVPDRFSFPSGHATAAMSVAFVYGVAYPAIAVPLLVVSMIVGLSRVFLGVHYPGDVLAGQIIAIITGIGVHALA
jgi:undecaprenyl-diphosphatase